MATRDQEQARAVRAKQLLEEELLSEAFRVLRAYWHDVWEYSEDPVERENAWFHLSGINSLEGYLEEIVVTGKLAAMVTGERTIH